MFNSVENQNNLNNVKWFRYYGNFDLTDLFLAAKRTVLSRYDCNGNRNWGIQKSWSGYTGQHFIFDISFY